MFENELSRYAEKLARYIYSKEFEPVTQRTPYYHMGATASVKISSQFQSSERYVRRLCRAIPAGIAR